MTRFARAGALLALAVLTTLCLAGPASAKDGHGRKHAKSHFKGWAKAHKAKGRHADPDPDGLSNWGEFRSHT
jgi:hypothetical protein